MSAQPLPTSASPYSPANSAPAARWFLGVLLVVLGLLPIGAVLGLNYYLDQTIPLLKSDITDSSWVGYTHALWFSSLGKTMGVCMLLMGLATGFVRRSLVSVWTGVVVGSVLFFGGSAEIAYRSSVAVGTAKVGCFVWESAECRALMKVPSGDSPSMYVPLEQADRTGVVHADWYLKQRPHIPSSASQIASTLPGGGMALVGTLLLHPEMVNQKLAEQRAELAKRRAAALAN